MTGISRHTSEEKERMELETKKEKEKAIKADCLSRRCIPVASTCAGVALTTARMLLMN